MFAELTIVFLRDFGVPCMCGAYAFTGILDAPDDTLNMGGVNVLSTMYVLQVQSSDVVAGSIASGSTITVNGQAFVVRDVLSVDDGVLSHLTLSK
jgi:hypothetical protein